MTLREDVTQEQITELRIRADEVDPVSGEMTPKRDLILKELDNAEKILDHNESYKVIHIDTGVSKKYDSILPSAPVSMDGSLWEQQLWPERRL